MSDSAAKPAEQHAVDRIGWLRAAVLGANDGIVSTASLIVGVAAAASDKPQVLIAGIAGLVAGALSMAAGEYVSVSSQADSEAADLAREKIELEAHPEHEQRELAAVYIKRGLPKELAVRVAEALSAHDKLEAHARDELGITEHSTARPVQAALASAASFIAGGLAPLLAVLFARSAATALPSLVIVTIIALALLGMVGAKAGGARAVPAAVRVVAWGSLAMAITFAAGRLFHATV